MANAQIYQKPILPSVQDGVDKCLILDPLTFYQRKFTFGDNWNKVKIGMFISYTNSVTDPNSPLTNNTTISSGDDADFYYTYIGLIKDSPSKYLPSKNLTPLNPNEIFVGSVFNTFYLLNISSFNTTNTSNRFSLNSNSNGAPILVSSNTMSQLNNPTGLASDRNYLNYNIGRAASTSQYFKYWEYSFEIINKGVSNQSILITSKNNISNLFLDDPSILKLQQSMAEPTSNYSSGSYNELNWEVSFNDGDSALPIPDSLFFYNGFTSIRPRFHAIGSLKIN